MLLRTNSFQLGFGCTRWILAKGLVFHDKKLSYIDEEKKTAILLVDFINGLGFDQKSMTSSKLITMNYWCNPNLLNTPVLSGIGTAIEKFCETNGTKNNFYCWWQIIISFAPKMPVTLIIIKYYIRYLSVHNDMLR